VADRSEPAVKPRKSRLRRVLAWSAFILFLLFAAVFTVIAVFFHRAAPILRARVIETLSTRFDSRVELASFDVSVFQGFEVNGCGLKLYPRHLDMQQPLFSVDTFSFRTGWRDLFRTPMHIGQVQISGLAINLPPKEQRSNVPRLDTQGSGSGKIQILVDELLIDRATLVLGTDKPGKVPLDFEISKLRMTSVGANQPMKFHAILTNPKPVGYIDSTGSFGPYNTQHPGGTPVSGTYAFSHSDLSTLKGIGGILSSTGIYKGTLNNIVVDGETDTPNFRLTSANYSMPLHTKFHAIVDGTNGDTYLQPVDARLGESDFSCKGAVINVKGKGHVIDLDVNVPNGRIQDFLQLGVKTTPVVMTGWLTMKTKLHIPPGKESVTRKIGLKGGFTLGQIHFTNPDVEDKVDMLSLRAQGDPKDAKPGAEDVHSEMVGQFELGGGKLSFSKLDYTLPGATVALTGEYSLDGDQFEFDGKMRTDAKVSQMVASKWKSILLKPVDPFFKKDGAGAEIPVKISGTKSAPKFGLDLHHKKEQTTK
jgi:hypothetical protein